MNCKTSIRTLIAVAAVTIGSATAVAHNGIEHIMGTVTAVSDNSITVDTVKHTTVTVMVDPSTTFTNKDAKVSLKDLKAGDRVVINAKAGADKKLQGISVKWGSGSNATGSHANHKM